MDKLVTSRLEYYFNLLQNGGSLKEDKIFLEYITFDIKVASPNGRKR